MYSSKSGICLIEGHLHRFQIRSVVCVDLAHQKNKFPNIKLIFVFDLRTNWHGCHCTAFYTVFFFNTFQFLSMITISCIYLLHTPNSRSVFHAGVLLNIHSFILLDITVAM